MGRKYDALGNRIRRTVYDGSLSVVEDPKFGYDGWDTALASRDVSASGYVASAPRVAPACTAPDNSAFNVWADLNASDNSLQTRRLFGNSYDAEIARISSAGTLAYYVQDRQNTVRYMLDGSGTVQAPSSTTATATSPATRIPASPTVTDIKAASWNWMRRICCTTAPTHKRSTSAAGSRPTPGSRTPTT